jgi:hypothetical protein
MVDTWTFEVGVTLALCNNGNNLVLGEIPLKVHNFCCRTFFQKQHGDCMKSVFNFCFDDCKL